MPIERERLRAWVYEALILPKQQLGIPNQPLQLNDISRWIQQKAQQSGLLRSNAASNPFAIILEQADEDAIRECIWNLIIQGIVVPGSSNEGTYQSNLPWIQVTEWGGICLQKGEFLPYDTGSFLSRLKAQIPHLDQIVELYLKEALNSFRAGNYLSAAVMVGVASERILIVLRDVILNSVKEDDRRKKFKESTENQTAKRIHDEIEKKLDPIREQLPLELQDSIGTEVGGIFQEIRRTRNDAGHPTGRIIEKEEAYALLQLFPVYAKAAYCLINWLNINPV